MLQIFVAALGVALLIGAGASALWGDAGLTFWLLIVGGSLTIGTIFERVFYKPVLNERPGSGWTDTGERFVDPETGETVDVFYNAASGERRYVTGSASSS